MTTAARQVTATPGRQAEDESLAPMHRERRRRKSTSWDWQRLLRTLVNAHGVWWRGHRVITRVAVNDVTRAYNVDQ
jgi:hypothetical protein